MSLAGLIAFAWLVYPTPYKYLYINEEGNVSPVRVNRITGKAAILGSSGWAFLEDFKQATIDAPENGPEPQVSVESSRGEWRIDDQGDAYEFELLLKNTGAVRVDGIVHIRGEVVLRQFLREKLRGWLLHNVRWNKDEWKPSYEAFKNNRPGPRALFDEIDAFYTPGSPVAPAYSDPVEVPLDDPEIEIYEFSVSALIRLDPLELTRISKRVDIPRRHTFRQVRFHVEP